MKILNIPDQDFNLLCTNSIPTQADFLNNLGVKEDSFAGIFAIRLYNVFFKESEDIKYSFNQYYKIEYEFFNSFLYKRMRLSLTFIKEFSLYLDAYSNIIKFKFHYMDLLTNYGENNDYIYKILERGLNEN